MSDPLNRDLLLQAMAVAFLAAGMLLLIGCWPWRSPRLGRTSMAATLGVGIGLFAGCWVADIRPKWPPAEDLDRFLLILLPAAVLAELLAILPGKWQWCGWGLRLIVAATAGRVLLHGSVHLLNEPDARLKPLLVLAVLIVALGIVWAGLNLLSRRAGRSVAFSLAIAALGSGVTVMLSGYASGGPIGLVLGAALAGVALASFLSSSQAMRGAVGVGVVSLFALVVMGRFFGELSTLNALLLFCAPLLGWLPELPYVRRLPPRVRGVVRPLLTALPVAFALLSGLNQSGERETSMQDYENFGK